MPELLFVVLWLLSFFIFRSTLKFSKLTTDPAKLNIIEESGEDLAYCFHGGEHALNTILLSLKKRRLLKVSKTRKRFKLNTSLVADGLNTNELVIYEVLLKMRGNRKGFDFNADQLYDELPIREALSSCFQLTKQRIFDLELVATNEDLEKKAYFKFLILSILGVVSCLMLPFATFWLLYIGIVIGGLVVLNLVVVEQRSKGLRKQMTTTMDFVNSGQLSLSQDQVIGVFGKKQFLKEW